MFFDTHLKLYDTCYESAFIQKTTGSSFCRFLSKVEGNISRVESHGAREVKKLKLISCLITHNKNKNTH